MLVSHFCDTNLFCVSCQKTSFRSGKSAWTPFCPVECSGRITPGTFHINVFCFKFPCYQAMYCLFIFVADTGFRITHKCIQIAFIIQGKSQYFFILFQLFKFFWIKVSDPRKQTGCGKYAHGAGTAGPPCTVTRMRIYIVSF